eukprot:TRINITY_DN23669_c0_g1_i1.p1 TRINITY_DN23669_c0_g1~~TRINITY_DN23669_c0_g1_i1.p1  ORF type:complete len:318 (-),score=41.54 TRINITY_DN23669_c0_g1_i1:26-979(-)
MADDGKDRFRDADLFAHVPLETGGQCAMEGSVSILRELTSGALFVRKAVPGAGIPRRTRELLWSEGTLLQTLKHPRIARLHTWFDEHDADGSATTRVFIIEHIPGVTCESVIRTRGAIAESSTVIILHQLLLALEHCHECGIAHRDVNPSNLMLTGTTETSAADSLVCTLIDFGLSIRCTSTCLLRDVVGTPQYMAPELLSQSPAYVGSKVDVWSAGVTALELLSGSPPFGHSNGSIRDDRKIHANIRAFAARISNGSDGLELEAKALLETTIDCWCSLPADAQALLCRTLCPDATSRPTAAAALAHAWLWPLTVAQ